MKTFVAVLCSMVMAVALTQTANAVPRDTAISMCNTFADNNPAEDREAFIARCLSNMTIDNSEPLLAPAGTLSTALFGVPLLGIALLIYFVPTFVAYTRRKSNRMAIFILNVFLGWTLVGWVIALVWAATHDADRRAA